MLKRLFVFLFLALIFSFTQADDKVKHRWLPLYSGGWVQPSVYVDLLSIKKIDDHTWEFLGSTTMPLNKAVISFEDGDGKTITLPRPAFTLFYYTKVDCLTEKFSPSKTDYYDDDGKLILSYKINPGQFSTAEPNSDVGMMYKHFCRKTPTKKDDA